MIGITDIHEAIFDVLSGALTCPVYDAVPHGAPYPFVSFGQDDIAMAMDTDDSNGVELRTRIHIWSRYQGTLELRAIATDIYDLLHKQHLDATGFITCDAQETVTVLDPDGKTRHAIATYRILLSRST